MGNPGEPSPDEARDAADFVKALQRLKERSGLTYRELERRAHRNGDVLARSTLADILRRTSLPRADVLAAFVRACGEGRRLGAWLHARERIAADATATAPPPGPASHLASGTSSGLAPDTASGPAEVTALRPGLEADETTAGVLPVAGAGRVARSRRRRARTLALAAGAVTALLAAVAWVLLPGGSAGPGTQAPVDGWVTIRPARTTELCLTDGRDRDGAYASAVAVQLACSRAAVPRTYLEPAGEGLYRIQWHHPQQGKGCLTVIGTGPVRGMLEPRNDCARATLFRLERTPSGSESYRIRPSDSSRCVGIAGDDTAEGAEATEERCTDAADQRFVIRPT
ncbi:helix-turn-helix domain-containing protein [Streptomyces sp. NPDC002566]|uniref:helix-turn-helix domain-containing protein n=1 Tax=Streptomyces sp. NPDC002566 TaxID=3364650 RepID=UPI003699CFB7